MPECRRRTIPRRRTFFRCCAAGSVEHGGGAQKAYEFEKEKCLSLLCYVVERNTAPEYRGHTASNGEVNFVAVLQCRARPAEVFGCASDPDKRLSTQTISARSRHYQPEKCFCCPIGRCEQIGEAYGPPCVVIGHNSVGNGISEWWYLLPQWMASIWRRRTSAGRWMAPNIGIIF